MNAKLIFVKRKRFIFSFLFILFVVTFGLWFFLIYLPSSAMGEFGIYLLNEEKPIISDREIISYNKSSHEIKLTEEGIEKISNLALEVPVKGLAFIVKINNKKVYEGAFWSPISSIPHKGIVIVTFVENETIKIEMDYPASNKINYDPRNNTLIFEYFQKAGKLLK